MSEFSPDDHVSDPLHAQGISWSEAEERRLYEALLSGEPIKRIAAAHGRTVGAIRSRLTRLGLVDGNSRLLQPLPPFVPLAGRTATAAVPVAQERLSTLLGRLSPEGCE